MSELEQKAIELLNAGMQQREVAKAVGRSKTWVCKLNKYANLDGSIGSPFGKFGKLINEVFCG
ncbi:hypothetical protein [Vibrio phage BUCT006]|nr:hypothetical protein [Vibrio phage BUCT006]